MAKKAKTFDEILASNPDNWEEDTLSLEIAQEISSAEIVEEFEEMDRQRATDWSDLAHQVVGRES